MADGFLRQNLEENELSSMVSLILYTQVFSTNYIDPLNIIEISIISYTKITAIIIRNVLMIFCTANQLFVYQVVIKEFLL